MSAMGERNAAVDAFVEEVGAYFRAVSEMPDPPHSDETNEPGWHAQSPSEAMTYASTPWIGISDVAVAYAYPVLIMTFRWTGTPPLNELAGFYALVVDGTLLNAEKCMIRIEDFLARKNWYEGAQRAGNINVVSIPSPSR